MKQHFLWALCFSETDFKNNSQNRSSINQDILTFTPYYGSSSKTPTLPIMQFWSVQLHFTVFLNGWSLLRCHRIGSVVITWPKCGHDNRWLHMERDGNPVSVQRWSRCWMWMFFLIFHWPSTDFWSVTFDLLPVNDVTGFYVVFTDRWCCLFPRFIQSPVQGPCCFTSVFFFFDKVKIEITFRGGVRNKANKKQGIHIKKWVHKITNILKLKGQGK